jgi:adenylate cyclase
VNWACAMSSRAACARPATACVAGQLIDTASGAHIWADRFDGALDDIFELQDQVASSVVGAIEPKLRLSEIERATRKPTESLDVYDSYLRALAELHKYTETSVRDAVALLRSALAIDASYSPAAAMIGWCRVHERVQGWGLLSDGDAIEAIGLARQAVEAGRDDPDTLWMAALTLSVFVGAHEMALGIIDRAVTFNPSSAHAWMASGWVSCFLNRPDRAIEAFQHAMRLSPHDSLSFAFSGGLAVAHLCAGRYEAALEWADRSLLEQPRSTLVIRYKVAACAYLGRIEEAREWLERMLELEPGLTVSRWKASHPAQSISPEVVAVTAEGLRKAGLPEV